MALIYIVEDDINIREIERYALKNSGFEVEEFDNGKDFFQRVSEQAPSLMLLDIMLPGEDGLEILSRVRKNPATEKTPVIMVTAKTTEIDKVRGLDMGADDYISKPFGVMELISRVKALLRRTEKEDDGDTLACGSIEIDNKRHSVTVQGETCELTFKEFELLKYLMINQGIVLSRDKLMNQVWGFEYEGESRTVDMHIKTLRHKLGDGGEQIKCGLCDGAVGAFMKKKINIRFIMIAALAIVVTALSAMLVYYNILKEQVFGDLKAYAHVIELLNIDDLAVEIEKDPYNPIDDDLRITLIGAEGEVLYESLLNKDEMDNHNERPEIIEAREKGEGEAIRYSATSGTHTFYYAERLQNGNVLRIGRDSVSVNRIMVNTLVIVLVIALCILFVCMGISHYLTKKLVEPIEKLATNIMLVDENNVYEEIRPFVNTIKEQHVNIINNAQLRQEFTANVSHELKTPLTAISGYAELIGNGMTGKEDTIRFSNEIHSNANRLLSLINDIIKLSELDEADHQMEMERIDLYKLAENCAQMMQVTAEKQGIRLILQGESTMVMANKGLMDEVFYNLCSNAIRYNKPGGSVTVTVGTKDERPFLSVADTGIGIPKECQERVFERFYRVDKSRSKSTGGTGLGLAIVKHIVAQHNAALHLDSELGEGTTIEIVF